MRYSKFQTALPGTSLRRSKGERTYGIIQKIRQPQDVVYYACRLDLCGKRRRTIVHARQREYARGTAQRWAHRTCQGAPPRKGSVVALTHAHDSLGSNRATICPRLGGVFEEALPPTTDWSNSPRTGNPVISDPVALTALEHKPRFWSSKFSRCCVYTW